MNVFYELIRFYLFSKAVFLGQFQAQNAFKTSSFFSELFCLSRKSARNFWRAYHLTVLKRPN